MKRQCKVKILLFFTILILQGCTTTRTIGQKLAEFGPITRMGVVFQQSSFGNTAFDPVSIGAFEANQTLIKLAPLLPTRMQLVFATNDIESKVILGHPNVMTINPWTSPSEITQLQDYQYLLAILPTSSTYQSYGGHISIEMNTVLIDRINSQKVWTGTIVFFKPGLAKVDDHAIDQFSKALLVQLNKDGVIQLKSAEPLLPKS